MKFPLFIYAFSLLLPHFVISFVQPESDGRSYFAVLMSSILELHSKAQDKRLSFTISPAAVQKTLAILYNSVEDGSDLLDVLLMEMGLKYFDAMRLMETALEQMTSFDALKEDRFEKLDKPIKRADVIEYFQQDFNELGNDIFHRTILTTPNDLELSLDLAKFAKEFFNASLLHETDEKVREFYRQSDIDAPGGTRNCINIYNEIIYTTKWKANFVESGDHLSTRGHFRYGEISNSENTAMSVRILELPLEANIPLSVLLILPNHIDGLNWSSSYDVIRPLTDKERAYDILKEHLVEIRLPKKFAFDTHIDLIEYLRKSSITRARIYEAPQKFQRIFVKSPKNDISLGRFRQNVKLKIESRIVKEIPINRSGFLSAIKEKFIDLTQTETFDVSEKSFLFLLKSDQVVYFMGHYYGNQECQ